MQNQTQLLVKYKQRLQSSKDPKDQRYLKRRIKSIEAYLAKMQNLQLS